MPHYDESTMRIGLDLDGVIIDHTQNKIMLAARYGVTLDPKDTVSEHMSLHFTPEVYEEIQQQLYDDTEEAFAAPLMEGAYAGLASIRELGLPYFLISRRKNPIFALQLLENRGLWGEYFAPENTFFVETMEDKDIVARRLGVTHYVDDEPRVLSVMPSVLERIHFDSRNAYTEPTEFTHVTNWAQLADILGISHK